MSASRLPEPSSVTVLPVLTVCAVPAFATGTWLTGVVVTVVVAAALLARPSRTTRLKVSVDAEDGAVKVGFAAVVLDSITAGPPVWVHA